MALLLFDTSVRGMALALLLLLAGLLWRDPSDQPVARIGAALALGLCAQVISGSTWLEAQLSRLWLAPWVAVSAGNALLFWLFARAMFDDDFVPGRRDLLLWLMVFTLALSNCLGLAGRDSTLASVSVGLQRVLPLVFSALACWAATAQWQADLVEGRRRLRLFIILAGAGYSVVMLGARLASPLGQLSADAALLDAVALLLIVAVVSYKLLGLAPLTLFALPLTTARPAAMGPSVPPAVGGEEPGRALRRLDLDAPREAPADREGGEGGERGENVGADDSNLAEALQRAMSEQRVYRESGLSVSRLAAMLGVPEYRLRRYINQRLGHRNFNAFINAYRLAEACEALSDATRRKVAVLTIALDAGFQSIGPFNRAFKASTGLTPTEYRARHLADS